MRKPNDIREFETTHWSIILLSKNAGDHDKVQQALDHVARRYWYPLYSFVRRKGSSPEDANDSVQGFFLHLVRSEWLSKANPERGRFRTFLLTSFRNFLNSERKRMTAAKRGGSELHIVPMWDAEDRFQNEPKDERSADLMFDRAWAVNLINSALEILAREFAAAGRIREFERLKGALLKTEETGTYSRLVHELGISDGALKVKIHRMRQRFREILRGLVASTVSTHAEIDEEMAYMLKVLRDHARDGGAEV